MKKLLYVLIVLCLSCSVQAHEDPRGEIYPLVSVENDKFVVYYKVDTPSEYALYRVVFDKNGERIEPPVKIEGGRSKVYNIWPRTESDEPFPEILRSFLKSFTLEEGEDYLVVPDEGPYAPCFLTKKDGKYTREEIDWGTKGPWWIHDAILAEDRVIVLVSTVDRKIPWPDNDLKIMSVNRQTRRIENYRSVGVLAEIWYLPICSGLLYYNGRVFLAWGERYIDGMRLNLSSWEPTAPALLKETISEPVNWNTHLSMALIDGIALLAYHNAKDGRHDSVIKTIKIDLRKHFR